MAKEVDLNELKEKILEKIYQAGNMSYAVHTNAGNSMVSFGFMMGKEKEQYCFIRYMDAERLFMIEKDPFFTTLKKMYGKKKLSSKNVKKILDVFISSIPEGAEIYKVAGKENFAFFLAKKENDMWIFLVEGKNVEDISQEINSLKRFPKANEILVALGKTDMIEVEEQVRKAGTFLPFYR